MPETPKSNQTLYEILIRIEQKMDDTTNIVARNKKYIDRMIGGLFLASIVIAPLVVQAIENLLEK